MTAPIEPDIRRTKWLEFAEKSVEDIKQEVEILARAERDRLSLGSLGNTQPYLVPVFWAETLLKRIDDLELEKSEAPRKDQHCDK